MHDAGKHATLRVAASYMGWPAILFPWIFSPKALWKPVDGTARERAEARLVSYLTTLPTVRDMGTVGTMVAVIPGMTAIWFNLPMWAGMPLFLSTGILGICSIIGNVRIAALSRGCRKRVCPLIADELTIKDNRVRTDTFDVFLREEKLQDAGLTRDEVRRVGVMLGMSSSAVSFSHTEDDQKLMKRAYATVPALNYRCITTSDPVTTLIDIGVLVGNRI